MRESDAVLDVPNVRGRAWHDRKQPSQHPFLRFWAFSLISSDFILRPVTTPARKLRRLKNLDAVSLLVAPQAAHA